MTPKMLAFAGLLMLTIPTDLLAQKIGDRRIVTSPYSRYCQVYRREPIDLQGNTRLMWVEPMGWDRDFVRVCANAINLQQYYNSRTPLVLRPTEQIVSAILDGRAVLYNKRDFVHACGPDGLVYDVFGDGSTRLHPQSLAYPDKRCTVSPRAKPFPSGYTKILLPLPGE